MMDELEAKGFNAQKVCVCDNKCSKSSNDVILYYFCFTVLLSVATSAESEKKKKKLSNLDFYVIIMDFT